MKVATMRRVLLFFTIFLLTISYGEAVKCYHCYDSYNKAILGHQMNDSNQMNFGQNFVRCDKNKNNWNTWECPARWPVCIVMQGTVGDHYEVIRSCAERDFCLKYVAPNGVKVDYCGECDTTLCNDYPRLPDPPLGPGPLFTFNVNINLNLKKYTALNNKDVN